MPIVQTQDLKLVFIVNMKSWNLKWAITGMIFMEDFHSLGIH
jgi:hypothetical protein